MSLEIKVPPVGESISEVVLSSWIKKDGDYVEMDEAIAELESDKATFELTAEIAGTLKTIANEGDTLLIGATVCSIEEGKAPVVDSSAAKPKEEAINVKASQNQDLKPVETTSSYASGVPSPAAAKILAEKGLETSAVNGSGPGGRITKDDALKTENKEGLKSPEDIKSPVPATLPGSRNERREKMTPLRKTVAKRLVTVKNETAMLTTFNEVDMQPIMALRAKYKDKFKE